MQKWSTYPLEETIRSQDSDLFDGNSIFIDLYVNYIVDVVGRTASVRTFSNRACQALFWGARWQACVRITRCERPWLLQLFKILTESSSKKSSHLAKDFPSWGYSSSWFIGTTLIFFICSYEVWSSPSSTVIIWSTPCNLGHENIFVIEVNKFLNQSERQSEHKCQEGALQLPFTLSSTLLNPIHSLISSISLLFLFHSKHQNRSELEPCPMFSSVIGPKNHVTSTLLPIREFLNWMHPLNSNSH